jgi:hypothetical protein
MLRHPPQATKALAPTQLYRVWKEVGSAGSTIYVQIITRETLTLSNVAGKFVRYELNYQKLHSKAEFNDFLAAQTNGVTNIVLYNPTLHYYDPGTREEALPFIVDWEEPERMY